MNLDSNGLIVQTDGDGGDTAGREGDYWFAWGLRVKHPNYHSGVFKMNLDRLQVEPGVFVRNPVQYNDPKDFSRDQTVPLILAMGEMEEHETLKLLLKKQVKNYFRYQNGDLGLPGDLGYYIRALRSWWAYPFLLISDLQLLVNSLIRVIFGTNDNTSDDVNHTIGLLQAQYVYPTPISYLARKIYKYLRRGGIQNAWDNYFKPSSGANPFNELYRPTIEKM